MSAKKFRVGDPAAMTDDAPVLRMVTLTCDEARWIGQQLLEPRGTRVRIGIDSDGVKVDVGWGWGPGLGGDG
jgi:hypothetical protein